MRAKNSSWALRDRSVRLQRVNHIGDHAPNHHVDIFFDHNIGIGGIFGAQHQAVFAKAFDALDGQFAIQGADDYFAYGGFQGAVHHQYVIGMNTRAQHRFAFGTDKKSRRRFLNQQLIQVQGFFHIIVGWRGKAGGDLAGI